MSHAPNGYFAHSITDIDNLFPNSKSARRTPDFLAREMEWVSKLMSMVNKLPWAKIKSMYADLTADAARAKGYVTAAQKLEEVFPILTRETGPQTIYKKQSLDRDHVIDIIDFDIVVWLKMEMRKMLREEIARALLIGDGRATAAADKIKTTCIRPIWQDDSVYVTNELMAVGSTTLQKIDAITESRKHWKGTGAPSLFVSTDTLSDMYLLRDSDGRRLYRSVSDLASELRVREIVEVPVMNDVTRTTVNSSIIDLVAVMVNPSDYSIGQDRKGVTTFFDDFDIDYNKHKYLLEARLSGALTKPESAVTVECYQVDNEP